MDLLNLMLKLRPLSSNDSIPSGIDKTLSSINTITFI